MKKLGVSRFARFALVGWLGAIVQLSLLALLTKQFHFAPIPAAAIAVEITLLHNWFWHERFTWRDLPSGTLRQRVQRLWRFHLVNGLVSLVGNTALTSCFVQRWDAPPVPSALVSIAICSLANFALADRWAYDHSDQYPNRN